MIDAPNGVHCKVEQTINLQNGIANPLHGKMINYKDLDANKHELSRNYYVSNKASGLLSLDAEVSKKLKYNKDILFMPIDVKEENLQDGQYTKSCYKIVLFGILENGRKASVILNGIRPYIEIQVPNGKNPEKFGEDLVAELQMVDAQTYQSTTKKRPFEYFNINMYPDTTIAHGKYFKIFAEQQSAFLRIYFYKLDARRYAITYLEARGYNLVHNDLNNYYRVVCRDYLTSFNSWCVLKSYKRLPDHDRIKSKLIITIDIDNYKPYPTEIIKAMPHLQKDPTLSMCWDCETYKKYSDDDRGPPVPTDPDHKLFMIGTTFQWYCANGNGQLLRICFIDKPSIAHPDYLTVICEDEKHLIKAFLRVWAWMLPDLILGFNDGEYDWPWLRHRVEQHGLLKFMAKSISQLWPSEYGGDQWTNKKILQRFYGATQYKLDAETNVSFYKFYYPGCIAIDVRTIFRQLFPTDEASSLNHYLTRLGIPTKLDINFKEMFDMYEEMCKFKPNRIPDRLLSTMQLVAHYCVIDAQRCHELMAKLYVIMDKRAVSNMSYVSFQDAIERANGMKVRNLIIASGQQVPFNLKFSNNAAKIDESKEREKFPGAFVFPPKKGLVNGKLSIDERIEAGLPGWDQISDEEIERAKQVVAEQGASLSQDQLAQYNFAEPIREFFMETVKRPITGLDFNSLYPSLIMAYNLSPEYLVLEKEIAQELSSRHTLKRIEFPFGDQQIKGWAVQHENKIDASKPDFKFGILGYILKQLFDNRKAIKGQMKTWEKKVEAADEGTAEHAEARFQYEYLNSTQKALKVFMNTFYGEMGNQRSPFFLVQIAGGITTNGAMNVKAAQRELEKMGCKIFYGDSIKGDSPLILQDELGNTIIRTIDDVVAEDAWFAYPQFKLGQPDRIEKQQAHTNYKIWVDDGWKDINRVIRHKTNKKMYRVLTHTGCVDVTEDHSLLTTNLEQIKPNECVVGTELHHSFPTEFHSEWKTEEDEYKQVLCGKCNETKPIYEFYIKQNGGIIRPCRKCCWAERKRLGYKCLMPTYISEYEYLNNNYTPSIEEAWCWGFFYADGSCGAYDCPSGGKKSWAINNQNLDYLHQALEYLKICEPYIEFKILNTRESCSVYKLVASGMVKLIVEKYRKLFYDKRKYKKVPDCIINAPVAVRRSFLFGYCIGDGCKPSERKYDIIEFANKGKIGSMGLYYIAKSLEYSNVNIRCRDDKMDIYSFRISNKSLRKNPIAIKKIIELPVITQDEYVYDIETSCGRFNAGVGELCIKNSDSIYSSMPDHHFIDIDRLYFSGQMTKDVYWSKLVEITLQTIEKIRDDVNDYFYKDNGTRFLTMAYEEVLFPVLFASKKKYVGIAHEHKPAFAKAVDQAALNKKFTEELTVKHPEYTAEQLLTAVDDAIIAKRKKQFFLRGLDVVKRGMPNFAKEIILDILEQMVDMDNTRELFDIVQDKIREIYAFGWDDPKLLYKFIMTDQYKPNKQNQKMHVFVKRMADEYHVEITPFERVRYIIAAKYPYRYDICGRQVPLSVGDKMELANIAVERGYNIDVDEYMQSKLFGQLGRLVSYRAEFLPPNAANVDLSDTKELKSLDEAIYKAAMKWVKGYASQFTAKHCKLGPIHQKISKAAQAITYSKLEKMDVGCKRLFVPKTEDEMNKLPDWIVEKAQAQALTKTRKYGEHFVAEFTKIYKTANDISKENLPHKRSGAPIYKSTNQYVYSRLLPLVMRMMPIAERVFNTTHAKLILELRQHLFTIRQIYYRFNEMVQTASEYVIANYNLAPLYEPGVSKLQVNASLESLMDFIAINQNKIEERIVFNDDELEDAIQTYNSIYNRIVSNFITISQTKSIYDELQRLKDKSVGHVHVEITKFDINEMVEITLARLKDDTLN